MICAAYRENAVSYTTCKKRYQKFRQGDFSLEDEPRAKCPQKIETNEVQTLLDINFAQTENLQNMICLALRSKSFPYVYIRWERFRREVDGFRINCPKTKIDTAHTLLSKFRK